MLVAAGLPSKSTARASHAPAHSMFSASLLIRDLNDPSNLCCLSSAARVPATDSF